MLTSLMVPLDGSAFAEDALPPAVDLAKRMGATLHLVRVHLPPMLPGPDAPLVADASWVASVREAEQRYLTEVADRFLTPIALPYTTRLLEGLAADALTNYAGHEDIDMIVMTTHGRGGLSRFWLGSVADLVVRRSHTPVLLYRPREQASTDPGRLPLRHILLPTDGSAHSMAVFDAALALGAPHEARFTLLRVLSPAPPVAVYGLAPAIELSPEDRARTLEDLEGIAAKLRARGAAVECAVEVSRTTGPAILEFAAANAVDAIALSTHGRGLFARAAMGSVADKVMRGAQVPVLLFRPEAVGRDEGAATSQPKEIHASA